MGIDPHRGSHTAAVLDSDERVQAELHLSINLPTATPATTPANTADGDRGDSPEGSVPAFANANRGTTTKLETLNAEVNPSD
jgi:hypothetical protein